MSQFSPALCFFERAGPYVASVHLLDVSSLLLGGDDDNADEDKVNGDAPFSGLLSAAAALSDDFIWPKDRL